MKAPLLLALLGALLCACTTEGSPREALRNFSSTQHQPAE